MQQRRVRRSHRIFWDRNWPASWLGGGPRIGSLASYYQCVVAVMAIIAAHATPVDAHAAPSGWLYPLECCSNRDCQPVHNPEVSEGPKGYVIGKTGEIVGYQDPRVRSSPDGEFHLCEIPGQKNARAICLFVPPRAS